MSFLMVIQVGLGASHQTGWTALIANIIVELEAINNR
jgi:hypothetical protein